MVSYKVALCFTAYSFKSKAQAVWKKVLENRDYEPYATKRDLELDEWLQSRNIGFHLSKDQGDL